MNKKRIAAIDIGSNSIRCIVVDAFPNGRFKVLDDEKAPVRLAANVTKTGAISGDSLKSAVDSLQRLGKLLEALKVDCVAAIATSAVRSAANGEDVAKLMSKVLGSPIRVISGEEEAELAALSAMRNFDMRSKRFAVMDIGGGSLELTTAHGNLVEGYFSMDIGAVRMTEEFFRSDPPQPDEYRRFQRHVRKTLKNSLKGESGYCDRIIGSGGTVTSLGRLVMYARGENFESCHGYEILRSEVVHQLAMMMRRNLAGRLAVPGINPDRADIVIAGIGIVDEVMEHLGANRLVVNERGIREGLIVRTMKENGLLPDAANASTWLESVEDLALSCSCDLRHGRQVSLLALSIFDSLAKQYDLKKRDRVILQAAALIHDIGYYISYSSHHKHSYHLIRHADLYGFTPGERELIAQIARYHRKSLPRKKHAEFQRLSEADRQTVCRLGGILRLADGLDRRRSGLVEKIVCRLNVNELILELEGSSDISVEIFGGNSKKDMLEKAFGLGVVFITA